MGRYYGSVGRNDRSDASIRSNYLATIAEAGRRDRSGGGNVGRILRGIRLYQFYREHPGRVYRQRATSSPPESTSRERGTGRNGPFRSRGAGRRGMATGGTAPRWNAFSAAVAVNDSCRVVRPRGAIGLFNRQGLSTLRVRQCQPNSCRKLVAQKTF